VCCRLSSQGPSQLAAVLRRQLDERDAELAQLRRQVKQLQLQQALERSSAKEDAGGPPGLPHMGY
jgi:hypothetical protein